VATPTPHPEPFGQAHQPTALGWVRIHNGSIEHFIHVECAHIGQVLGLQGIGLKSYQRDQLMAGAIARVILHEWIHISNQSPHHARNGITKAQFGVADLVAHASKPHRKQGAQSSGAGVDGSKFPALDAPSDARLRGTK
jgi:hypothetical protein